jgi:hypothetical protein
VNTEASEVISGIVKERMGLEDDQVWISEQNIDIPEDERLYIVIGMISSQVTSNNQKTVMATISLNSISDVLLVPDMSGQAYFNRNGTSLNVGVLTTIDLTSNLPGILLVTDGTLRININLESIDLEGLNFVGNLDIVDVADTLNTALVGTNVTVVGIIEEVNEIDKSYLVFSVVDNPLYERQYTTFIESIQIDMLSRSDEARTRRYELLASLVSTYSMQQQEENNIKIYRVPSSFTNTSQVEGGSKIKRYTIRAECNNIYSTIEELSTTLPGYPFYDHYPVRVDDEKSIETDEGIINFELPTPT